MNSTEGGTGTRNTQFLLTCIGHIQSLRHLISAIRLRLTVSMIDDANLCSQRTEPTGNRTGWLKYVIRQYLRVVCRWTKQKSQVLTQT